MHSPRLSLSTVALGFALFSIRTFASDASSDRVVVSATRVPTPDAEIASGVTVIANDQIEANQQRTLPEVLQEVQGLNLVQSGGPGGQTSIFMRGTNSNHTKVLVDGIDVSDPSSPDGSFDYAHFLTMDIDRIEVLRGPQSGLYGSDAIGGVINIITRSGSGPARLVASIEGGSFDTFNQTVGLSGSEEDFHYAADVTHFHSGETPVTPLNLLAPGERRIDDYYDNVTASTKLGYDLAPGLDLGFVARYTNGDYRFTGEDFSTSPSFPAAAQSEALTSEYYSRFFGHLVLFDGVFDQTLGVAYTRSRTANYQPDAPLGLDTGERTKIDWQGTLKLATTETLVLGAEHARDEISEPLSASTNVSSEYAELQSQLWGNIYSAINIRNDDNSLFGDKVTYRVAPAYVISSSGTKIKASIGTGFKAPTLSELFQDFPPFFFANPNLKPETSIGYDLGIEQGALDGKLHTGVTYFHNRLHDLITTDAAGTTYANVGRATTQGIESFISYQPLISLNLRADYTYTEATDDILNQELLRRPKHKISVNGEWQPMSAVSIDATLVTVAPWVDGNRDFSISRLDAPGYTTINLAANYDITAKLKVFARIDNLFDRHYENPTGFLQPRLGAFAGVAVEL